MPRKRPRARRRNTSADPPWKDGVAAVWMPGRRHRRHPGAMDARASSPRFGLAPQEFVGRERNSPARVRDRQSIRQQPAQEARRRKQLRARRGGRPFSATGGMQTRCVSFASACLYLPECGGPPNLMEPPLSFARAPWSRTVLFTVLARFGNTHDGEGGRRRSRRCSAVFSLPDKLEIDLVVTRGIVDHPRLLEIGRRRLRRTPIAGHGMSVR